MGIMGKSKRLAAMKDASETPKQETKVDVTEEVKKNVPPWAQADCRACGGTGFNSRGNPCFVCDHASKEAGGPEAADYDINVEGERFTWSKKDDAKDSGSQPVAEDPVTVENNPTEVADSNGSAEQPAANIPDPEPESEEQPDVDDTEPDQPGDIVGDSDDHVLEEATIEEVEEAAAPKAKKKQTRQKKSFTLMINCVFSRGNQKTVYLDKVLQDIGSQLAKDQKVGSYYDLDPFKRRDILASKAEAIAAEIGTAWVIASPGNPDSKALLDVLRPFATTVVEGTQ